MHLLPLAVLIAWIPFGVFLFYRYPVRVAVLINFLGGWAILPGAPYVATSENFPFWVLGVCLPTTFFVTKATVVGLAALVGVLCFHRADWRQFRPGLRDLPIVLWSCVPVLTAATHWATLPQGLRGACYQAIAWGVPWVLGRRYFSEYASLLLAAKACVIGAICYVPICLFEICVGPQLYAFLYCYQPYRWVGAQRYIGFRPIGLMEDGNQLAIWMAAATLIAFALALHRLLPRVLGLPIAWVAAALAITTLLCQSVASLILLVLLSPLTLLKRRSFLRAAVAILIFGIVFVALFRMNGSVSLRAMVQHNGLAHSLAADLSSAGRSSFVWRLARDESHMGVALQHPLLGSGLWNWWQNGNARPWSLWLLVFGMYGLVGLAAFGSIIFLPVVRTVWRSSNLQDPLDSKLRLALVALILIVAFDNLLNGAMILPYLLFFGGVTSPPLNRPSKPAQ